ncbi:WecB/TagA/CpsF family glycosyltransferase [Desulfobulbus sp. F3]|nr:WecB/TagA/CpsF family glycosyltransferase [Desulfobulbus sp. F3]
MKESCNTQCSEKKDVQIVHLLGVRIDTVTKEILHSYINSVVSAKKKALVLHVNIHCYTMINQHPWLLDFLNSSNVTFCDGAGVKIGAKFLRCHIPERITYADWMWSLAEFAEQRKISFFFLGAKPYVAEKAANQLKERFPDLYITVHHGYFNKTNGSAENKNVIERINAVKPNILIVGFGMPIQEKWLQENFDKLNINVALTGGAVFDYISGELKRGPRWMTDHNMEWLARLMIEPRRLFWRYFWGNSQFICMLLKEKFRQFFTPACQEAEK